MSDCRLVNSLGMFSSRCAARAGSSEKTRRITFKRSRGLLPRSASSPGPESDVRLELEAGTEPAKAFGRCGRLGSCCPDLLVELGVRTLFGGVEPLEQVDRGDEDEGK